MMLFLVDGLKKASKFIPQEQPYLGLILAESEFFPSGAIHHGPRNFEILPPDGLLPQLAPAALTKRLINGVCIHVASSYSEAIRKAGFRASSTLKNKGKSGLSG
jgi:hypothetical protein